MQRISIIPATAAIALLAACGNEPEMNGYGTDPSGRETADTRQAPGQPTDAMTDNPLNPIATEAEPAELDTIRGGWGFDAENCGEDAWIISQDEFITGPTDMLCTYTPDTVTASLDNEDMSTSFAVPAECALGDRNQPMVFTFTLSEDTRTLYISGSEGIDLTLRDCESINPADGSDSGSENAAETETGANPPSEKAGE